MVLIAVQKSGDRQVPLMEEVLTCSAPQHQFCAGHRHAKPGSASAKCPTTSGYTLPTYSYARAVSIHSALSEEVLAGGAVFGAFTDRDASLASGHVPSPAPLVHGFSWSLRHWPLCAPCRPARASSQAAALPGLPQTSPRCELS